MLPKLQCLQNWLVQIPSSSQRWLWMPPTLSKWATARVDTLTPSKLSMYWIIQLCLFLWFLPLFSISVHSFNFCQISNFVFFLIFVRFSILSNLQFCSICNSVRFSYFLSICNFAVLSDFYIFCPFFNFCPIFNFQFLSNFSFFSFFWTSFLIQFQICCFFTFSPIFSFIYF